MKNQTQALEHASIRQYCKATRLPTVGANFQSLAEQAVKENHSHIRYLEALLSIECEERDRHAIENRIRDAHLPRLKTLEEFDFAQAQQIPATRIRELAEGGYIERKGTDCIDRRVRSCDILHLLATLLKIDVIAEGDSGPTGNRLWPFALINPQTSAKPLQMWPVMGALSP